MNSRLLSTTPHQALRAGARAVHRAWPLGPAQADRADRQATAANLAERLHTLQRVLDSPLDVDQVRTISLAYHEAMQRICRGQGDDQAACTLIVAANVGLLLAERGYGDADNLATIVTAQQHLAVLRQRGLTTGRWRFTGPAMSAVNALLCLHDQQMAQPDLTERQLHAVMREVHARMQGGHVIEVDDHQAAATPGAAATA